MSDKEFKEERLAAGEPAGYPARAAGGDRRGSTFLSSPSSMAPYKGDKRDSNPSYPLSPFPPYPKTQLMKFDDLFCDAFGKILADFRKNEDRLQARSVCISRGCRRR